jgi:hypothetical protein
VLHLDHIPNPTLKSEIAQPHLSVGSLLFLIGHSSQRYTHIMPRRITSENTQNQLLDFEEQISAVQALIKKISSSKTALLETASKDDLVYTTHTQTDVPRPELPEAWNRHLDRVLGEDTRNAEGRLPHVRGGRYGIGQFIAALARVVGDNEAIFMKWLDAFGIRLERLKAELTDIL